MLHIRFHIFPYILQKKLKMGTMAKINSSNEGFFFSKCPLAQCYDKCFKLSLALRLLSQRVNLFLKITRFVARNSSFCNFKDVKKKLGN